MNYIFYYLLLDTKLIYILIRSRIVFLNVWLISSSLFEILGFIFIAYIYYTIIKITIIIIEIFFLIYYYMKQINFKYVIRVLKKKTTYVLPHKLCDIIFTTSPLPL